MPKNDKKSAVIRLIVLVIVMVNQALVTLGWNPLPFSEDQIYEFVSILATIATAIYAWWKNNNVTPQAESAQKELERKKRIKL